MATLHRDEYPDTATVEGALSADSDDDGELGDEETSSKVHLTTDDYRIIVSWLENEKNFASVYGKKKMVVGGEPKMTKKQAFQVMADHLHKYSTTPKLPHLKGRNMEQRWKNHLVKFKKVLRMKHTQTGLGITIKEMRRGITIDEKLERKCACFARLKFLFGERPNISASSTLEIGVPPGCTRSLPSRSSKASIADCGSSSEESDATEINNFESGRANGTTDSVNTFSKPREAQESIQSKNRGSRDGEINDPVDASGLNDDIPESDISDDGHSTGQLNLSSRVSLNTKFDISDSSGDSEADGATEAVAATSVDRRTGVASGLREHYLAAIAEVNDAHQELMTPPSSPNGRKQRSNHTSQTKKTTAKKSSKTKTKGKRQSTSSTSGGGGTTDRAPSHDGKSKQTAQQSRLSISDNFSRAMIIRQRNDKRRLDQFEAEAAERKKARECDEAHRERDRKTKVAGGASPARQRGAVHEDVDRRDQSRQNTSGGKSLFQLADGDE